MKKNSGAALITVLVIVFIVMAIIADLTVTNFRMIRRLENRQLSEQALTIAFSAIDFGRAALATSGATSSVDTLKDVWAQGLPRTKVLSNLYMSGTVIDEQSKFNINDLAFKGQINANVVKEFSALLGYLNIPQSLAYNIAWYIAAPQFQGQIMQQYINAKPAYRPAGRPFVDLAELTLVKGVTPQVAQKLVQYVTAIPVSGYTLANESAIESVPSSSFGYGVMVNANTASAEVIAAKSGIPLLLAQRMISYRMTKPFQSSNDIITFLNNNGINTSSQGGNSPESGNLNIGGLGVSSSYFTIHVIVDDGDDQFKWVAYIIRRNRSGPWPQILWQHPE